MAIIIRESIQIHTDVISTERSEWRNLVKDVSTALDMTMVALDMTMLAGADPYERHTDEDEHQVDGLGAEVPLLEDEGGACERYDHRTAAYQ